MYPTGQYREVATEGLDWWMSRIPPYSRNFAYFRSFLPWRPMVVGGHEPPPHSLGMGLLLSSSIRPRGEAISHGWPWLWPAPEIAGRLNRSCDRWRTEQRVMHRRSHMVVLRLKRMGRRHRPFYRLNAMDKRAPRDGRVIEELGWFDPLVDDDKQLNFKADRIKYWLSVGAQPSDTVRGLLKRIDVDPTPGTPLS